MVPPHSVLVTLLGGVIGKYLPIVKLFLLIFAATAAYAASSKIVSKQTDDGVIHFSNPDPSELPAKPVAPEAPYRERVKKKHPDWPTRILDAIDKGDVLIGMDFEQVEAAWGPPDNINTTETARSYRSQWVYRYRNAYVYFGNSGLVSTIQR
jgi:hypothetical protein